MLAYSFFWMFLCTFEQGSLCIPWMFWNPLYRPGWPQTQREIACLWVLWFFFLNNALDIHMNFRIHWRLFFRFWCGLHSRCFTVLLIEPFPNIKYAKWGIKKVCLLVSLISFFSVNEVFIVELFHLLNYNMYS